MNQQQIFNQKIRRLLENIARDPNSTPSEWEEAEDLLQELEDIETEYK